MADKIEVVFTAEQEQQFSEVEALVAAAVLPVCDGCSTPEFAPKRIARAVALGNFSMQGAEEVAVRLSCCRGLFKKMLTNSNGEEFMVNFCHFPSGTAMESDEQMEIDPVLSILH